MNFDDFFKSNRFLVAKSSFGQKNVVKLVDRLKVRCIFFPQWKRVNVLMIDVIFRVKLINSNQSVDIYSTKISATSFVL